MPAFARSSRTRPVCQGTDSATAWQCRIRSIPKIHERSFAAELFVVCLAGSGHLAEEVFAIAEYLAMSVGFSWAPGHWTRRAQTVVNVMATPFMQYLSPVGWGPSLNTWPR
jgi:hypothetical protein